MQESIIGAGTSVVVVRRGPPDRLPFAWIDRRPAAVEAVSEADRLSEKVSGDFAQRNSHRLVEVTISLCGG